MTTKFKMPTDQRMPAALANELIAWETFKSDMGWDKAVETIQMNPASRRYTMNVMRIMFERERNLRSSLQSQN